jgi:hypothetical protein
MQVFWSDKVELKKKALYNRCYEKFQDFKKACVRFFRQSRRYLKALRSLLADNFPILGAS